jgi:hypothetical protein
MDNGDPLFVLIIIVLVIVVAAAICIGARYAYCNGWIASVFGGAAAAALAITPTETGTYRGGVGTPAPLFNYLLKKPNTRYNKLICDELIQGCKSNPYKLFMNNGLQLMCVEQHTNDFSMGDLITIDYNIFKPGSVAVEEKYNPDVNDMPYKMVQLQMDTNTYTFVETITKKDFDTFTNSSGNYTHVIGHFPDADGDIQATPEKTLVINTVDNTAVSSHKPFRPLIRLDDTKITRRVKNHHEVHQFDDTSTMKPTLITKYMKNITVDHVSIYEPYARMLSDISDIYFARNGFKEVDDMFKACISKPYKVMHDMKNGKGLKDILDDINAIFKGGIIKNSKYRGALATIQGLVKSTVDILNNYRDLMVIGDKSNGGALRDFWKIYKPIQKALTTDKEFMYIEAGSKGSPIRGKRQFDPWIAQDPKDPSNTANVKGLSTVINELYTTTTDPTAKQQAKMKAAHKWMWLAKIHYHMIKHLETDITWCGKSNTRAIDAFGSSTREPALDNKTCKDYMTDLTKLFNSGFPSFLETYEKCAKELDELKPKIKNESYDGETMMGNVEPIPLKDRLKIDPNKESVYSKMADEHMVYVYPMSSQPIIQNDVNSAFNIIMEPAVVLSEVVGPEGSQGMSPAKAWRDKERHIEMLRELMETDGSVTHESLQNGAAKMTAPYTVDIIQPTVMQSIIDKLPGGNLLDMNMQLGEGMAGFISSGKFDTYTGFQISSKLRDGYAKIITNQSKQKPITIKGESSLTAPIEENKYNSIVIRVPNYDEKLVGAQYFSKGAINEFISVSLRKAAMVGVPNGQIVIVTDAEHESNIGEVSKFHKLKLVGKKTDGSLIGRNGRKYIALYYSI